MAPPLQFQTGIGTLNGSFVMKAQLTILATLITGMACGVVVHADLPQKATTRIEFNSLIDSNNQDKTDLQKSMVGKMDKDTPAPADATEKDQKKVLDLVDVEVGLGQDRPVVVDRRYNSVGEPIVDKSFSNAKVQLVDDQAHGS
jgi:hypothetical protein